MVALQLLVEDLEGLSHLGRSANGSEGIVLVDRWNREHRHHRVSDELLDGSAPRQAPPSSRRSSGTSPAGATRIEALAHRGRARDVAEDDRHGLADLLADGWGQGRRARRAEGEVVWDSPHSWRRSAHVEPMPVAAVVADGSCGAKSQRPWCCVQSGSDSCRRRARGAGAQSTSRKRTKPRLLSAIGPLAPRTASIASRGRVAELHEGTSDPGARTSSRRSDSSPRRGSPP